MTRTQTFLDRCGAYDRMAAALCALGESWRDWPDLARCASGAGLSPRHFQRKFSRWAGISPRQYQAMLAHAEAGRQLREGATLLETTYEVGLSSPGRLHDLFIAHEGLSPGQAKAGGDGAVLRLGEAPTPFGLGVFLISAHGLCGLGFADPGQGPRQGFVHPGYDAAHVRADLSGRYPAAEIRVDDALARDWAQRIFERDEPLPVALYGTPFRRQIWRALLTIPPGETRTYGEVAAAAGRPGAARAAGTAIGANSLAWLIPCHRALAADQRLHNYHWGLERKRAMLTFEAARCA
jgi:AraC family transcriptional regulator of adaptative response/methylated-DNA-[protein]-cysteine methyltransferase